ncbi:hypothetical protein [Vibrio brasiliensis]|uniref:hypothetical protein n=1 Tax=Vibrio brasiliensis TaxID=170652 RepID=UPI001EFDA507|nr:hypothetical protein [Vibrio brasiliensis]MCG9727872.1 hypothetical protein [Vibrio brasiliensis]
MNNDQSIASLKEQLFDAKIAYSWEYKGAGLKYNNLFDWAWSVIFGALFLLFLWYVIDELTVTTPAFWGLFFFMTIMVLVSRYLFSPDKYRCYHLTALGIHYTEQDMIPEVAYKIVRGFAWVGIVVCFIAVFLLGPLALVGAGAFALMSFGMTNFKPTVDKCCLLVDDRSVAFNLINDGVMSFAVPEKGAHAFSGDIYISPEQKEVLLSHLWSIFPNLEVVKIKRLNDQYKHPVYQQSEETSQE